MLKEYPQFKKGEVEEVYSRLSKSEKELLKDYLTYRKARGLKSDDKVNDVRRYILHLRYIFDKDFKKVDLKDLREILSIINSSKLSGNVKNHIKTDLQNFLKYLFPDWSIKFSNFDDVRLGTSRNEEKINSSTIFSKEDIENLMKHETSLFWKAFLMLQYEGGLRTIEARTIEWNKIKLDVDKGISEINVFASKTEHARTIFVKEATYYLQRLKEEQENTKDKGIYVFHSKSDKNKPIDKGSVSIWFRNLTMKALGREGWAYLLRHSRATELYKLADENKISKETAIKFMGHSKDMSATYTHLNKKDVEDMLKNQVYHIEELSPKEENKLKKIEKELSELKEKQKLVDKFLEEMKPFLEAKRKVINGKEYLVMPPQKRANKEGEKNG